MAEKCCMKKTHQPTLSKVLRTIIELTKYGFKKRKEKYWEHLVDNKKIGNETKLRHLERDNDVVNEKH